MLSMIEAVLRIPMDSKLKNVSVFDLVSRSGYRESPAELTQSAVESWLRREPDLVRSWMQYSEDKRVSSGWYVCKCADGKFEVGFYPVGEKLTFSDSCQAVAYFIVREVADIGGRIG